MGLGKILRAVLLRRGGLRRTAKAIIGARMNPSVLTVHMYDVEPWDPETSKLHDFAFVFLRRWKTRSSSTSSP